jgi:hypothetical protein
VTAARYVVPRDANQLANAFRAIADICKSKSIACVRLIVPKTGGWEHTIVAKFLGPARTKALLKRQSVPIADGVSMTLESAQNFRSYSNSDLLVGVHISIKDMNKLDDSPFPQVVMFLPWSDLEEGEWRATWSPDVIGAQ